MREMRDMPHKSGQAGVGLEVEQVDRRCARIRGAVELDSGFCARAGTQAAARLLTLN
jgi:hypothetical protein